MYPSLAVVAPFARRELRRPPEVGIRPGTEQLGRCSVECKRRATGMSDRYESDDREAVVWSRDEQRWCYMPRTCEGSPTCWTGTNLATSVAAVREVTAVTAEREGETLERMPGTDFENVNLRRVPAMPGAHPHRRMTPKTVRAETLANNRMVDLQSIRTRRHGASGSFDALCCRVFAGRAGPAPANHHMPNSLGLPRCEPRVQAARASEGTSR